MMSHRNKISVFRLEIALYLTRLPRPINGKLLDWCETVTESEGSSDAVPIVS